MFFYEGYRYQIIYDSLPQYCVVFKSTGTGRNCFSSGSANTGTANTGTANTDTDSDTANLND